MQSICSENPLVCSIPATAPSFSSTPRAPDASGSASSIEHPLSIPRPSPQSGRLCVTLCDKRRRTRLPRKTGLPSGNGPKAPGGLCWGGGVPEAGGDLVMVSGFLCLALGVIYISLYMNVRLKLRTLRSYPPILSHSTNWGRSQASAAMTQMDVIGPPPQTCQRAGVTFVIVVCDPLPTTQTALPDRIQSKSQYISARAERSRSACWRYVLERRGTVGDGTTNIGGVAMGEVDEVKTIVKRAWG